jgi:glycosyltransferase involved in cell wall biosynthesis
LLAARGILDRVGEARFAVVGEGGGLDDLRALAQSLGLSERTIFTGFRRDVPAVLGALDLFLCTSRTEGGRLQEGLPGAVIEAQAAGVPVVAFRLPMSAEMLVEGTTGAVVPEGDAAAMAEAAVGLLLRPAEREAASAEARRWAQRFSLERCVERTLGLYEELLREAKGP